jgi:hypothetical protein
VATRPLQPLISAIGRVLLGKETPVKLALACLLARGHLLIEDLPGMGKTTLAEALARGFGLSFKRVSFTSDLLPADLTGINVFDTANTRFHFQPGRQVQRLGGSQLVQPGQEALLQRLFGDRRQGLGLMLLAGTGGLLALRIGWNGISKPLSATRRGWGSSRLQARPFNSWANGPVRACLAIGRPCWSWAA